MYLNCYSFLLYMHMSNPEIHTEIISLTFCFNVVSQASFLCCMLCNYYIKHVCLEYTELYNYSRV